MKPPLPAVLYGTGIFLAFGAGWFLKPATSPYNAAALSLPALPAKQSGPPLPQKPADSLAASGGNWLRAAQTNIDAIRAARQPGVVNQVLIEKLKAVLSLQDETTRLTRWRALVETMRAEDAQAVRTLMRNESSEGRSSPDEERAFWQQWGSIDGKSAAELATKEYLTPAVTDILAGWARVDPVAALSWLKRNPTAVSRPPEAIKAITSSLAADSTESAVQFLRSHAGDAIFQESLGMEVGFTVRAEGLAEARIAFDEIARSTLPDTYKSANLSKLIGHYGNPLRTTPPGITRNDELIEISRQYLSESWFPGSMAQYLSGRYADKDPASGIPELARFTNMKSKELYASNLFDQWSRKNPGSLSEWLSMNRSHETFDLAAFRLVVSTSQSDPEAAKAWAAEIKDPTYQDGLQKVFSPQPLTPHAQ